MKPRAILVVVFACFVAFSVSGCSGDDEATPTDPIEKIDVDPEIVAWLQDNAVPFSTVEPGHSYDDLLPLKAMIGDARIVSLGEATHGTSEFFKMKHRLLEFLVEEMGFTCFAIEATWPESNLVNDYIHTGAGDPAVLLAGLYFWTWNTQEVLDQIMWMRQKGISFYGFDMQAPQMSYENVMSFVESHDPENFDAYELLFKGFKPYMTEQGSYRSIPPTTQTMIRGQLQSVYNMITEREALYVTRSSQKEYDYVLQSARLVQQAENVFSYRSDLGATRDLYMAENTEWILNQEGPDAKIVLWAHNYHVRNNPLGTLTMGTKLRERYGDDMAIVGFSFFKGSFNAVTFDPVSGYGALEPHAAPPPPKDAYGYHFRGAQMPRLILDLRGVDFDSTATSWLPGPRRFRSIGAVYSDGSPEAYYYDANLTDEFDIIVYLENTSPSALLPFPASSGSSARAMWIDRERWLPLTPDAGGSGR